MCHSWNDVKSMELQLLPLGVVHLPADHKICMIVRVDLLLCLVYLYELLPLRIVHSGIYYDCDMNPLYIVGLKPLGDKLCVMFSV